MRPVPIVRPLGPVVLLFQLEVGLQDSRPMPVRPQYAAISMATMFIVSAASVARYSVIRFQACA